MDDDENAPLRDDVAVALRELAWTIHRKAPDRAGVGPIPTTEIALLKQIIDTPGLTVGELAQSLGLRQPNVSAALRALVQRGFALRQQAAHDRRSAHIVATDAGIAEHQAVSAAWAAPVHHAISTLDASDFAALAHARGALETILRTLRSGDQQSPLPAMDAAGLRSK